MVDETKTPGYRAVAKRLREPFMRKAASLNLSSYWTLFRLPPEISSLRHLRVLTLVGSPVRDLSPIAHLTALEGLNLDGSRVADLAPLAGMTRMQDAAVLSSAVGDISRGLSYGRTPVSRIIPFNILVRLTQPARTVETINEVRRRHGLPEYVPDGYERPAEMPTISDQETDEEKNDSEQLGQKPASHSFALRGSRIEAQPQIFAPRYPDVAEDIRGEVGEKAKVTLDRLAKCNAPGRLISTVDRLASSLGETLADICAGILQMRFRSLEADMAAYDTEDGRKELPEDAFAMLRDLTSSVEDLMGCFPQLAEIEAERLAQRLKDADVPNIIDALSQIRLVAEESEAVAPSSIDALKAGEVELNHDAGIIDSEASVATRVAAVSARDRTVGYMLLVYRNFVAGVVKAGNELAGLSEDTWKDFRQKAPEQLSNAGIALTIAALVNALLGPTAAMGAFALSFKPLRDRAMQTADKLAAFIKKERSAAGSSVDK
jgi:hypothetical protein